METTRLSTKGQIVIPKTVREAKSWNAGMEFTVEETRDGVLLRPARRFPETTLKDVVGSLHRPGMKRKSLAQMDAGISQAVKRRHDRGRY